VVEGGTLLRCYTSQRGIEGSNPSSSALELVYLQDKLGSETKGRDFSRPLLRQPLHQPASWPCRWSGSPTLSVASFRKLVQQAMCPLKRAACVQSGHVTAVAWARSRRASRALAGGGVESLPFGTEIGHARAVALYGSTRVDALTGNIVKYLTRGAPRAVWTNAKARGTSVAWVPTMRPLASGVPPRHRTWMHTDITREHSVGVRR
jgi:hypothetical protein